MSSIVDTFVASSTYNSLPLISQVAEAPEQNAQDLEDLRDLLKKHNVPEGVSIRLIHKHFDTAEGEIMVFDKIPISGHGIAQIMKPIIPSGTSNLRGVHFFVDHDGLLQAYEYANYDVPDMRGFEPFLADFCQLVSQRGLQRKFGLKLQLESETEKTGWTEYEMHAKRGTIMFSGGMPMPDGESDFSVTTEWKAILHELPRNCKHTTTCAHGSTKCKHCRHCTRHDAVTDDGMDYCVGGNKVLPGTPVYDIVQHIVTAF